jgi:hypothetical protein
MNPAFELLAIQLGINLVEAVGVEPASEKVKRRRTT